MSDRGRGSRRVEGERSASATLSYANSGTPGGKGRMQISPAAIWSDPTAAPRANTCFLQPPKIVSVFAYFFFFPLSPSGYPVFFFFFFSFYHSLSHEISNTFSRGSYRGRGFCLPTSETIFMTNINNWPLVGSRQREKKDHRGGLSNFLPSLASASTRPLIRVRVSPKGREREKKKTSAKTPNPFAWTAESAIGTINSPTDHGNSRSMNAR